MGLPGPRSDELLSYSLFLSHETIYVFADMKLTRFLELPILARTGIYTVSSRALIYRNGWTPAARTGGDTQGIRVSWWAHHLKKEIESRDRHE